jgi:hypothetical protein
MDPRQARICARLSRLPHMTKGPTGRKNYFLFDERPAFPDPVFGCFYFHADAESGRSTSFYNRDPQG